MIFYQGLLERKIWDPELDKVVIDFGPNKVFETDDEEIIEKLIEMGYPTEDDMRQLEATGTLPHGGFEKRDMDSEYPSGRPAVEEQNTGVPKPMIRNTMNDPLPNSEAAEIASLDNAVSETPVVKRKKVVKAAAKKALKAAKGKTVVKPKKIIRRKKAASKK